MKTLEELKKILDAALAASKADPENEELKTKAEEAQAAYDAKKQEEDEDQDDESKPDESKWDKSTAAYIKKLRKEAADNRTKKKDLASQLKDSEEKRKAILKAAGIEDESEKPEEKLKTAVSANEGLAFENAVMQHALKNGVGSDQLKYFQFLVADRISTLEEGEELSEDEIAELAKQARKAGGKGPANTGVGNGGKGGTTPPPAGNGGGEVTLGKFVRMNMGEKEKFYRENPDAYKSLMKEARQKNMLV